MSETERKQLSENLERDIRIWNELKEIPIIPVTVPTLVGGVENVILTAEDVEAIIAHRKNTLAKVLTP